MGYKNQIQMLELSIVIPVYNVAPYLPACLESVFGQTGFSFEVILVDDASTDNSGSICGEYARRDERVRYIRHARNAGLSSARNTGLVAARGRYITFVDSDDFLARDTLTRHMELLRQRPEVDVLEYPVQVHYGAEHSYLYQPAAHHPRVETFRDWVERGGYRYSFAWNKIYRRSLWQGLTFPEGLFFEDMYVVPLVMQRASVILAVPGGLYYYCSRNGSITTRPSVRKCEDLFHASLEFYRHLIGESKWSAHTLSRIYLYVLDRQIDLLQAGGDNELPARRSAVCLMWGRGLSGASRFKALLAGLFGGSAARIYCVLCKILRL